MKSYLNTADLAELAGIGFKNPKLKRRVGPRMPQKDVYSKKITSEEEQKNFVLVLKDRLSFFPEEGETFKLIHNGQPRKAKIESYPCSCRGPDQPHSHYFVKSKGLRAGDRITIQHDVRGGGRYFLQVQHHPRRT